MKQLTIILLFCALGFSQELKVEGDLNVTGAVINDSLTYLIDSLQTQINNQQSQITVQQTLIEQLQAQIILLGQQLGLADCNGEFGGDAVLDECGVCGGDGYLDICGVCNGDNSTCGILDVDGNQYLTVQIGDQLWMAENLKVTHYNDGSEIPTGYNNSEWTNTTEGAYAIYNDEPVNAEIYGNLYNWYAVDDERGICPEGWHVPSDDEFKTLEMFLGMSETEANSLGDRGTNQGSQIAGNYNLWNEGILIQNIEFGYSSFDAIPAGFINYNSGASLYIGTDSYMWLSTASTSGDEAFRRTISFNNLTILRSEHNKRGGFSIRCIQD